MSPDARERLRRIAAAHGPWIAVTILGLWLLWPVPLGRAPLSADHTVHLTRIWMWAQSLAGGDLRGWSSTWFLGTPIGELYPVLGDMIVIGVRVASLGLLDWHQAYAIGVTIAFLVPAWAMVRIGRTLGIGPIPGVVAGALLLLDAGAYREGGWIYTMTYGVWPQHLSTGLTWLGLSELAVACTTDDREAARRRLGWAILAIGGALLAHPMAMLGFAIGGPLLVLVVGPRPLSNLRRVVPTALVGGLGGLAVAAWWLVPMLQHRGWMASYGWMWMPLSRMAAEVAEGRWAQHMPAAVGTTIGLGLVALAIVGGRRGRLFGAYALVLWLASTRDVLWDLRLDLLSSGFAHLQYQRFIIAAKPGLWLAAGFAVGGLAELARRAWRAKWPSPPVGRALAVAAGVGAFGLAGWMASAERDAIDEYELGQVQLTRAPEPGPLDTLYPEVTAWLAERWAQRDDAFWRVTVVAPRNVHWFMDAPVLTGAPLYKQGFTPGDNFVHKPETGRAPVLDAARVRYVVAPARRAGRGDVVADFGELRILERATPDELPVAWLDGPGTVETLTDTDEEIRVRVSGTEGPTRLTFAVAGYPRWQATHDGTPLDWYEVPIVGDGAIATAQDRRSGVLRGGKANGDDGTEPTLLAVDVGDGEIVLEYRARRLTDVLAGLLSLLAIGLAIVLIGPRGRFVAARSRVGRAIDRLAPLGHPAVPLAALGLVTILAAIKMTSGRAAEDGRAIGRVLRGPATFRGVEPGLLKTSMLIRPAVLVQPRRLGPARLDLPDVTLGETLTGFIAIDDDAGKVRRRGQHRYRILATTADGQQTVLRPATLVHHRPDLVPIEIPTGPLAGQTVTLTVIVDSEGEAPPPLGFDLQLEAAP